MSSTTEREARGTFPLAFGIHPGFEPVDLALGPEERANHLIWSLGENMPELENEQVLHLVLANDHLAEAMLSGGVIYAANFVGRSQRDPTSATTAQFTVSVREAQLRQTRPLEAMMSELRDRGAGSKADLIDLDVGRCLAIVDDTVLDTPVTVTGDASTQPRHVRQLQVVIPLIGHDQLALFALSTEFLQDWPDYSSMMAEICKSITWRTPDEGSIGSILDGPVT